MSLTKDELDRLAAEGSGLSSQIAHSVYCEHCGYNLKSLPYSHVCPECGNRYSARSLSMKGIFLQDRVDFPIGDIVTVLLCVVIAAILIISAWVMQSIVNLLLATGFIAMGAFGTVRACRRYAQYRRMQKIADRIADEPVE